MKFNRTTIIFVILSLGLTVIVYVTEIKPEGFNLENKSEQANEVAKIFPFPTEEIKQIKITLNQKVISFEKQGETTSLWQMTQPEKTMASEAAINFLLNLFPQAEKTLSIPVDAEKKREYGLLETDKSIEIILKNGHKYQMILGNPNFDDTQIYAEVIFPPEINQESAIVLVSKSFQYAIERDFAEWKQSS
jgi:hypothetical protein